MSANGQQVVAALAAAGYDTRPDERGERAWDADCPCCNPVSDGLWPLRITEAYPGGPAVLCCTGSCEPSAILVALSGSAPEPAPVPAEVAVEGARSTRPKLRVLDLDRMLRTQPPPVPWLVEGLLARGAVTMLAGREGQGKSLLALRLAAALGHGHPVAGIDCAQGRVLLIDAENGEPEIHRRVLGLGVKPGTLVPAETDGLDLRADLPMVEATIEEHRPDLVVLDSLRSLTPALMRTTPARSRRSSDRCAASRAVIGARCWCCTTPGRQGAAIAARPRSAPPSISGSS